ncbi:MAG: zinc ribbon domain-containing protein [Anaerolineae bacterium]|nr:zinc ribbon domain-containing protein [Anaerolineae bacterium]
MIYCPKCGVPNLEDRKFCIQCGAALEPEKGQRCPMCGAINPPGNVFCDECQARLVPVFARPTGPLQMPPSLKGLSLPTKPVEEIEKTAPPPEPEIPETAPEPEASEVSKVSKEEEGEEGEEEPGWLVSLRAKYGRAPVKAEEVVEETPAWLQELHEAPAEAAAPEAPDWLRELRRRAEEEVPAFEEKGKEEEKGAPPSGEEEEIPPWLAELRAEETREETAGIPSPAEAGETPPVEAPAEQEEVPDWLRSIREGGPPPEEAPPLAEAEEAAEELPDWLREIAPQAEEGIAVEEGEKEEEEVPPLIVPPAEAEEAAEELPDWLREIAPQAEEEIAVEEGEKEEEAPPLIVPPAEAEEAAEELPDWLREIAPPEEAPPAEVTSPAEAGVPEWLQGVTPGAEAPPPAEAEKEAPSWLQEISAVRETPVPEETAPAPEAEERMPSWLQELAPISGEAMPSAPPEEAPIPAEEGAEEGAAPAWLEELKTMEPAPFKEPPALAEAPAPPEEGVEEGVAEEIPPFPAGAEELAETTIPAWVMALRPPELEAGPAPSREEVIPEVMETSGLLAGIPGVLPAEPVIGVPHTLRPPTPMTVPGELALEAKLLGEVTAQERPPAVSIPKERGKRLMRQAGRLLLYLALIAAILIPYFFYTGLFEESVPPAPETEDFYRTIENLSPDSVVLVAFDYDPSLAAEMNLQAEALIHHLMKRGLKVMTISMYPSGPALAEDILRGAASVYGYQPAVDYINLGYLPNLPASLRAFAGLNPMASYTYEGTPASETPLGQRINRLSDFGLIVELAAGQDTLRWWIEQVGSRYPGLPMVAGVSASLDPYVRPYYETPGRRQLKGLLVGLPGAAQYEGLTGRTGRALDNLESQGLAHLTIVAVIVVGNIVYLVSRLGKGK